MRPMFQAIVKRSYVSCLALVPTLPSKTVGESIMRLAVLNSTSNLNTCRSYVREIVQGRYMKRSYYEIRRINSGYSLAPASVDN